MDFALHPCDVGRPPSQSIVRRRHVGLQLAAPLLEPLPLDATAQQLPSRALQANGRRARPPRREGGKRRQLLGRAAAVKAVQKSMCWSLQGTDGRHTCEKRSNRTSELVRGRHDQPSALLIDTPGEQRDNLQAGIGVHSVAPIDFEA
jgi:hypothetical protein